MEVSKEELIEFKTQAYQDGLIEGRRKMLEEATALLAYFLLGQDGHSIQLSDAEILNLTSNKYEIIAHKNHNLSTTYKLIQRT